MPALDTFQSEVWHGHETHLRLTRVQAKQIKRGHLLHLKDIGQVRGLFQSRWAFGNHYGTFVKVCLWVHSSCQIVYQVIYQSLYQRPMLAQGADGDQTYIPIAATQCTGWEITCCIIDMVSSLLLPMLHAS
jgi:hypothetical protein